MKNIVNMLHFNQYFNLKYIDFILIVFSLISLIIFIQLIINAIKNRNNSKNDDDNNIKKTTIINVIKNKVIPIIFAIIFFIQSINILLPEFMQSIFPPDSTQNVIITNNEDTMQKVFFIGRLSYSNEWIPITPIINFRPCLYIKLNPNEKKKLSFRTGTKDIDHIMIAKTNNTNFNISKGTDALVFSVPSNDIAIYTLSMNKLNASPNISIIGVINYFLLYIVGLAGIVMLFLIIFYRIKN
ncbi:MAG: hypothetical protein FWG85_00320 [Bacteroidetes bacterium]|nr:hypothetical protein [Bacteroidota bacterium]